MTLALTVTRPYLAAIMLNGNGTQVVARRIGTAEPAGVAGSRALHRLVIEISTALARLDGRCLYRVPDGCQASLYVYWHTARPILKKQPGQVAGKQDSWHPTISPGTIE